MRSMHWRSHRMKADACKLEHSLFSLSVSLVLLTCHAVIFCILNPPFPFHVSSHQGGQKGPLWPLQSLSRSSPIQSHSSRSTRAPLHFTTMTTSSSVLIPYTISSLLVRPQGLFTAGWIKFRGLTVVLGALQPGSLCLPLNVNILYMNRHGNTPGLI